MAYGLLAPTLVAGLLLIALPMIWNLAIAVQELRIVDLRDAGIFNPLQIHYTLENFRQVLSDPEFIPLLLRTGIYAGLGAGLATSLGLVAALALRRPFPGRAVVRALMLVPYILPLISVTFVWRVMLSPLFGIVNAWLVRFTDLPLVDFLGTRSFTFDLQGQQLTVPLAFAVVIAFEAWRYFPFAFIFILARLQAVSSTLEEAAVVDGATISQRFRYVVFPEIRTVLLVIFLIRFIWNFNDFSNVYLLTGGGAGTRVISVQVYEWLLARSNPGAASALAIFLAVVLALLAMAYFRFVVRGQEREAAT